MNTLRQWFLSEFSTDELSQIALKMAILGNGSLTPGEVLPRNYVKHLYNIAGCFINDPSTAERFLLKATELIDTGDYTVLDEFFLYSESIRIFYKNRGVASCKYKAIEACIQQIKMAPAAMKAFEETPGFSRDHLSVHNGYNHLAWILEEDRKYKQTIALCGQAMKQGWPGEWNALIVRCRHKAQDTTLASQS
ncbi:MAG: hypothetical protein ACPG51_18605 [Thiolinea sp.]